MRGRITLSASYCKYHEVSNYFISLLSELMLYKQKKVGVSNLISIIIKNIEKIYKTTYNEI